jgi:FlaG/FlaF family flagellin (archaellin)
LIAFTVAVAGIISIWLTGFARVTTSTISSQANIEIICNNGQISLSNLKYCSSSGYLSGDILNSGTIALGNITIQIIYANGTQHPKLYLSLFGSSVDAETSCCGNLTISPGEKYRFNTTVGSNYEKIRVITNCTAKATDEASSSDVSLIC